MKKFNFVSILVSFLLLGSLKAVTAPSGILYYVPITIQNTQTTATPNPFQQMIQVNVSKYSSYMVYNSSFANFEFFYANAVTFKLGSNANQPDLQSPNTIDVSIGANKTSVSLTVHPTYQTVYYKNISLIANNDAKAYNMAIKVDTPISGLPSGSVAKAYIYAAGATRTLSGSPPAPRSGYIAVVDLTTSGLTTIGSLSSGSDYEIDIYTYIPEGTTLPSSPTTAQLYLVYSPETISIS